MPHQAHLTYTSYLKLDQILDAQAPRSEDPTGVMEHDEMLFIVIHQVFELWIKQVLHELDHARAALQEGRLNPVMHTLNRVLTILKVMVRQVDVLETMTPCHFNAFRSRLEAASGLQSAQFRELEFLVGYKRPQVLDRYPAPSAARERLERRLSEPTLWDAFLRFLAGAGHPVPAALLERNVTLPVEASEEVEAILARIYRQDDEFTRLCERLLDFDEGLQEWRYRHVKMVQRTIGSKPGTGGSAGVEYLLSTLHRPLFPDLWNVRARL